MLKATDHLKKLAMPVIEEMKRKGLSEMDMKDPEGFLVTTEPVESKGYMPVDKIVMNDMTFLICHR